MKTIQVNDRVRFATTTPDGSVVRYSARVVKVLPAKVWVEVPARVRALPFPPANGKKFALYAMDYCLTYKVEPVATVAGGAK